MPTNAGHQGRWRTLWVNQLHSLFLWPFNQRRPALLSRRFRDVAGNKTTEQIHILPVPSIVLGPRDTSTQRRKWFTILWEGRGWRIVLRDCDVWPWGTLQEQRGESRGKSMSKCREMWKCLVEGVTAGFQGPGRRVTDGTHRQFGSDCKEHWRTCWRIWAFSWEHQAGPMGL